MLVLFSLFIFLNACLAGDLDRYEVSCNNAKQMNFKSALTCSMVDWPSANLYLKQNFTVYDPGPQLSVSAQNKVADNMINALFLSASSKNMASQAYCKQAITRLVCIEVFPYCPITGNSVSSISYLKPCRKQCEQVSLACGTDSLFDCSRYDSQSCTMSVAEGYFLLPQNKVNVSLFCCCEFTSACEVKASNRFV